VVILVTLLLLGLGARHGDRLVSVAGTPVTTWTSLRAAVEARGNEPTEVAIDRAGTTVTVLVAILAGLSGPPKVIATFFLGVVRLVDNRTPPLSGPVGVVREIGPPSLGRSVASAFGMCASVMSYLLPIVIALSIVQERSARRRSTTTR